MMLAVRSHVYAKLIQLARCKFKIFWVKLLAEKIFEYVKRPVLWESFTRITNLLAPAVNFVIFMAQRPPANIALLGGRVKFTITLSNSPKCCRLPGYEDVVGWKNDSSLWKNRLLVVSSEVYWFLHLYMSFLGSKDDQVLCVFEICCRVQTDLRRSFVNLS